MDSYPGRDSGSSIATQLITIKQTFDPISCFKPLLGHTHRKISDLSKTVLILLHKLVLCVQKLLTQTLGLP